MTDTHPDWQSAQHFVLGYGSLLSASSRALHSDNVHPALAVTVHGFKREWITRAFHEAQTYVGATPSDQAILNAHCVPFWLNPKLQARERDYRFVQVSMAQIEVLDCPNAQLSHHIESSDVTLWICESLDVYPAHVSHPIYQSYIDTCLSGCISHFQEHDQDYAELHARHFVRYTNGWQHVVNDRSKPKYPRGAEIDPATLALIDTILHEELEI